MTNQLQEQELLSLTLGDSTVAVAECIEGLGCAVYSEGKVLPPWASKLAEELVGVHVRQGTVITSQVEAQYFVLKRDKTNEEFKVLRGPLNSDELRATL